MSGSTRDQRAPVTEMVPFLDVCNRLGVHRNTGYLMVKEGTFPIRAWRLRGRLKCRQVDVEAFFAGTAA
jgi:predicted DNA-binding transcriptional regulator AlpA